LLYAEWHNKAMGVVFYGLVGGARAAEHLRLIAGDLQMAEVRTNVALAEFTSHSSRLARDNLPGKGTFDHGFRG
jgi:NAD(P)H-dependent FMN reductase